MMLSIAEQKAAFYKVKSGFSCGQKRPSTSLKTVFYLMGSGFHEDGDGVCAYWELCAFKIK